MPRCSRARASSAPKSNGCSSAIASLHDAKAIPRCREWCHLRVEETHAIGGGCMLRRRPDFWFIRFGAPEKLAVDVAHAPFCTCTIHCDHDISLVASTGQPLTVQP